MQHVKAIARFSTPLDLFFFKNEPKCIVNMLLCNYAFCGARNALNCIIFHILMGSAQFSHQVLSCLAVQAIKFKNFHIWCLHFEKISENMFAMRSLNGNEKVHERLLSCTALWLQALILSDDCLKIIIVKVYLRT